MNDPDIKLDAIFVGPQKTGTTWIYRNLNKIPSLIFPKGVKETFFFDLRYKKGIAWYESHFKKKHRSQKCLEVAPSYFDIPEAADRIKYHYPDCKIVITLRDPVDKTYSLYLHHKRKGRINVGFHDAIKIMPRLVESGHYAKYIPIWIDHFGKHNILVILLDDIAREPFDVISKICDFVGTEKDFEIKNIAKKVNQATIPYLPSVVNRLDKIAEWLRDRKMYFPIELVKKTGVKKLLYYNKKKEADELDEQIRNDLRQLFRSDIEFVEDYLRKDLSKVWK